MADSLEASARGIPKSHGITNNTCAAPGSGSGARRLRPDQGRSARPVRAYDQRDALAGYPPVGRANLELRRPDETRPKRCAGDEHGREDRGCDVPNCCCGDEFETRWIPPALQADDQPGRTIPAVGALGFHRPSPQERMRGRFRAIRARYRRCRDLDQDGAKPIYPTSDAMYQMCPTSDRWGYGKCSNILRPDKKPPVGRVSLVGPQARRAPFSAGISQMIRPDHFLLSSG